MTKVKSVRRFSVLLFFLFLVGCTPQSQSPIGDIELPTVAVIPTETLDLSDPLRSATAFLGAWEAQDFATMYSLLQFNTQETITQDDFTALYEDTQLVMTMESLTFEPRAMSLLGERTAQLVYDLTFHTRIVGDIEDNGRTLTVVLDTRNNQWRIAWNLGDVIPEFASGARLDFQSNVPSRSNIYASTGEIIASMQGVQVEVFVVREDPDDWETCRQTLIDVVDVTGERIDAIFANAQATWRMRVGTIESTIFTENQVRLENDCEATFSSFPTRQYNPGSTLPHVLGHVGLPSPEQVDGLIASGFDAETIIGQAGVEQTWNDVLLGSAGGRLQIVNPDGTVARVLAQVTSTPSQSIWLTIELDLQQFIVNRLNDAFAQNQFNADGSPGWGSTSPGAAAVVMNVNTGAILAMVSYPTYDANAYTTYPAIGRDVANQIQQQVANDARNPLLNRVTQGQYPAGSIFKVVGALAALDTGIYDANTTYYCSGTWTFENDTRFDWFGPGHGSVTVRSALMQSCNPFNYELGFTLNNADPYFLPNYARRMGLGVPTGITDLAEGIGQIPDPDLVRELYGLQWTYSNAVNLSIGQGEMSVTPLQMVRLYGAIANGGNLLQPYVVAEQGILNQRTPIAEPTINGTFDVSNDILTVLQQGLCDVTTQPLGTASHIFRDSPLMDAGGACGKTGTAQDPNGNLPFSWFASYAPIEDPEIAVIVLVENAGDGSAIAAPITRDILEYYYLYSGR